MEATGGGTRGPAPQGSDALLKSGPPGKSLERSPGRSLGGDAGSGPWRMGSRRNVQLLGLKERRPRPVGDRSLRWEGDADSVWPRWFYPRAAEPGWPVRVRTSPCACACACACHPLSPRAAGPQARGLGSLWWLRRPSPGWPRGGSAGSRCPCAPPPHASGRAGSRPCASHVRGRGAICLGDTARR